jgi:soluble lytic murein transglycosylase-like protein
MIKTLLVLVFMLIHVNSFGADLHTYMKKANPNLSDSDFSSIIHHTFEYSEKFDLSPSLLLSIFKLESRFNTRATNRGAIGLGQVIPKYHAAKIRKSKVHTDSTSLHDPKLNIYVTAWILRDYIDKYGSIKAGLTAYNGNALPGYANKILKEAHVISSIL